MSQVAPRRKRHSVALVIETSNAYARGLLRGVMGYVREHRPWSVFLQEQGRGASPPAWLARWKGDGIIARVENEAIAEAVQKTQRPVIDTSAARLLPNTAWVETDDLAIARLAAEHFLERGFKRLAYCGDRSFNWSNWRRDEFIERLRQRGLACEVFDTTPSAATQQSVDRERARLTKWVASLPKPIGVFACYDIRGQLLLDICRELGLAVPEEVAVLGVDNDEVLCDLSTPSLTSIIPNARRAGYVAAELLDRLMSGDAVPPEPHLIEPLGIATRQSTDVLAIEDREIAAALRFIREHACDGIQVQDVLAHVPLSRRVLESRFRKSIGRTPHDEIVRLRIERVKELLSETDLPLVTIADRAGFVHVEYLTVAFKREVGVAPSAFRKGARSS